jgi:hypothetical protein
MVGETAKRNMEKAKAAGSNVVVHGPPDVSNSELLAPWRGKSGAEILREADARAEDLEAQRTKDALAEIQWLEGKKAYSEKAAAEIAKFVVRARMVVDTSSPEPIAGAELVVQNGTAIAVAGGRFAITLATPGSDSPEYYDTFTYDVQGEPLAPGTTATWLVRLPPGGWTKVSQTAPNTAPGNAVVTVKVPDDAVVTAEAVSLRSADGKADLRDPWRGEDAHRLALLKDFVRERRR